MKNNCGYFLVVYVFFYFSFILKNTKITLYFGLKSFGVKSFFVFYKEKSFRLCVFFTQVHFRVLCYVEIFYHSFTSLCFRLFLVKLRIFLPQFSYGT